MSPRNLPEIVHEQILGFTPSSPPPPPTHTLPSATSLFTLGNLRIFESVGQCNIEIIDIYTLASLIVIIFFVVFRQGNSTIMDNTNTG
jgi:hypothetical protein